MLFFLNYWSKISQIGGWGLRVMDIGVHEEYLQSIIIFITVTRKVIILFTIKTIHFCQCELFCFFMGFVVFDLRIKISF